MTIKNPLEFRTQGIGRRPWLTSHLLGAEAVIKAPSHVSNVSIIQISIHYSPELRIYFHVLGLPKV